MNEMEMKIRMPKNLHEFLTEFGEWIGYDRDQLNDEIVEMIRAGVEGLLDRITDVSPIKVNYFRKKYNL